MSRLSVLVHPAKSADERPARNWLNISWLVVFCYLFAAYLVTFHIWPDPAGRVPATSGPAGISNDVYLSTWSLRYVATALSHGHLPALTTTALNWPQGVNLMWNTSMLLPAVVLTPVTLWAGPTVSLSILLLVGFAGSATAMYFVLRRWGASAGAAALAGAFYGFSPAMRIAAEAHYHLQLAILPPLIIDLVLRLVTGRGRPVRTGLVLGLLVAAQLFTAEELLVETVLAGLIIVVVLAASRPAAVRRAVKPAAAGLGTAVAVAAALCGYPLWVQLHGPLAETGSPWHVSRYGNQPADFVAAPASALLHGSHFLAYLVASGQREVEYFGYLGWPMLVLPIVITIVLWRDLRVRVAGMAFVVLELLSIGGHAITLGPWHIQADVLPWHWLQNLPVLNQALPNRLSLLADGAAAVLLAFAADKVWTAVRTTGGWRKPALTVVAAAALLAAIVPVLPAPVQARSAPTVSASWHDVMKGLHLRPGAAVLVLPLDGALTMELQAISGEPISVVGGYCIAPDPSGRAASCETSTLLTTDQQTTQLRMTKLAVGQDSKPAKKTMALALAAWRPAAIITTVGGNNALGRYLLGFLGPPTAHNGAVLGWRINPVALQRLAQRYGGKPISGFPAAPGSP
ncbi:MAG: hypothetical protein ACLQFR_19990 [Streptosporangiaceae bacterium]